MIIIQFAYDIKDIFVKLILYLLIDTSIPENPKFYAILIEETFLFGLHIFFMI